MYPPKNCFSGNIKIYPVSIEIKSILHETEPLYFEQFLREIYSKYVQIFANFCCLQLNKVLRKKIPLCQFNPRHPYFS